ncbi:cyclophilin-like protein, partial [Fragilariopsis cylindrus CCMP1102]
MSQVYSTEPQTSANVIFETTYGPLSIHLWLKECPRTTMYFLQLCADGFYDNIVFHRIVPNFLIQTGDSKFRINQQEQDAEALDRRQFEVNSRIRFNHRGQVAMALGIDDDDTNNDGPRLQPQFFITLEDASHLDNKHVIFGGVTGPTIFNALRIGQIDV